MNDYQITGLALGFALFSPFFLMLAVLAGQFVAAIRSDIKKGR